MSHAVHRVDTAAVLALGFRPFFVGAVVFAVITAGAWTLVYTVGTGPPIAGLSPFQWHAHEMIYGYSLAVIAGFLLTAAKNWTGIQTVNGSPLLVLFGLWAAARVCMLFGTALIHSAAVLDVLFSTGLVVAFAYPVFRAGKWKQVGILMILMLFAAGNTVFYLGSLGHLGAGVEWGVYGGLYLVIGLILVMGRRVIPLFIQGGVDYPVTLFNSRWIDRAIPVLFVAMFVADVFGSAGRPVAYLSGALFVANLVRLVGWYTPGIWKKPLLWSLYVAYAFIVLGFLLLAWSGFGDVSRFVAIHSLTYGGIGLVTLSMMTRVSLGHTGRNVHTPPVAVFWFLFVLVVGAGFRVLLPLADMRHYIFWIAASQIAWILAFSGLAGLLIPILVRPRDDGRPG